MKRIINRLGPQGMQSLNLVGVSGLFWAAWAVGCYSTVYLQSIGFSASSLGILNAISSAVAIASVSFWGMVSDKIGSPRKVLIILLAVGGGGFAFIPLIPTGLPISTLLFMILLPALNFFRGSMATFNENLIVRNCNERGLNYGVIRGLGSFLFTICSLTISFLLPYIGVPNTFWLHALFMIPVIVCVYFAREPQARPAAKKGQGGKGLNLGELFKNRRYVAFLIFAFVFYLATNTEGAFVPYFIAELGIASERYGIILAYRALLEIPFLVLMVRLRRRFPLRNLIILGVSLMTLEPLGFSLFSDSLFSVLFFCTFWGLGNGLFIGSSLNYLYEMAPDHLKASAQAFYASVSSIAGILGNLIGGMVFDAVGAKSFYFIIFCLFVLSVVIFVVTNRNKKPTPAAAA